MKWNPDFVAAINAINASGMTTGDIAIEVAGKPVYRRHDGREVKPMDVSAWLARLVPFETDGPVELQPPFVGRT